jgi:DNA polymerase elongation subunit (family B)
LSKAYENVFQHGNYGKDITIREYDTETKKISFKKIKPNDFVPEIYSLKALEGFEKSNKVTFDTKEPLFVRRFDKSSDLQRLINPNKATDEEKELRALKDEQELTEEQQERLEFLINFRREQNKEVQKHYYGNTNKVQKVIRDLYPLGIKQDHDFHTIWIDIETDSGEIITRDGKTYKGFPESKDAYFPVTVIQIYDTKTKKYLIWAYEELENKSKEYTYIKCKNEKDLLEKFITYIENDYPAIMIGFNSFAFDFPYIANRIRFDYPELDVTRLSPVNEIKFDLEKTTHDDYEYIGIDVLGIHLMDLRDLVLKYGFLNIPSFSLNVVATEGYGIEGKHSHEAFEFLDFKSSHTGKNIQLNTIIESEVSEDDYPIWKAVMNRKKLEKALKDYPDNEKIKNAYIKNEENIKKLVWEDFIEYAFRDVKVMLEIEKRGKFINTAKMISYITGVNITEVSGTLKQWNSYLYNLHYKSNEILPLTQKKIKDDDDVVYKAGFTFANPGLYRYVISVDFSSLYPNIFVSTNIGADTIIPEDKLPKELLDIRKKYCNFYTNENFYDTTQGKKESDAHWKERIQGKTDGILVKKYNGDTNNIPEEKQWIFNYIKSFSEEDTNILKKHNVTLTPDGYFYHHKWQSKISVSMEENIQTRYNAKYKAIDLADELEKLKSKNISSVAAQYIQIKEEQEYQESLSTALKININSAYGSMPLKGNTFSNGKLTAANLTITGRLLIHSVAQAMNNYVQKLLGLEETWEFIHIAQMDTDSVYFCLDKLIEKVLPEAWKNHDDDIIMQFIQKFFEQKLSKVINKTIADIGNKFNLYKPEALKMDQEIVSNSFISLIKKRYFTRILYNDGHKLSKPKIKMVGISLVSKSTPKDIKTILEPTLNYFLDHDKKGLEQYLKSHYDDFKNIDIKGLAIPKSVSSLDYDPYYDKRKVSNWKVANKFCKVTKDNRKSLELGFDVDKLLTAPENSVGSIVHNKLIEENNLNTKYEYINPRDKIKVIHVIPNDISKFPVICFKDPKSVEDIGLKPYINYEKFWQKEIIEKVDRIAEKIDWKINVNLNEMDVW